MAINFLRVSKIIKAYDVILDLASILEPCLTSMMHIFWRKYFKDFIYFHKNLITYVCQGSK